MLDPVLGAILLGIVGVSLLMGAYSAYLQQSHPKSPNAARQTGGSHFRQSVIQARIPALFVFFPIAISSVLVYLFIGRGGGPPPIGVQLREIGAVLLMLGTTIGGSTLIGSIVGGFLQQTPTQE